MLIEMSEKEYRVVKRVLDEASMLDEDLGLGLKLGTAALMLAMALGVRGCNGAAANHALENIRTPEGTGTTLFQEYNAQNWAGKYSKENSKAKALFAAIVTYAQEHHVGIAEAAKIMKGELFAGLRHNPGLINKIGNSSKIGSVVTTTDGDEEIVVVTFRYQVKEGENTSYVTSQIVIPSSAAETFQSN